MLELRFRHGGEPVSLGCLPPPPPPGRPGTQREGASVRWSSFQIGGSLAGSGRKMGFMKYVLPSGRTGRPWRSLNHEGAARGGEDNALGAGTQGGRRGVG